MNQAGSAAVSLMVGALGGDGRPPRSWCTPSPSCSPQSRRWCSRSLCATVLDARSCSTGVMLGRCTRTTSRGWAGSGSCSPSPLPAWSRSCCSGRAKMTTNTRGLLVVFAGGLAIHLVGLYDDLHQLRARWKFLAQIAIAVLVFAAGVRMTTLSLPFVRVVNLGPWAGLLFTVIWFVGITNAFNLIDGLDGLAAGAALFALTTMFVVAISNARYGAALRP